MAPSGSSSEKIVGVSVVLGVGLALWLWMWRKNQLKERHSHAKSLKTQASISHTDSIIEIVNSAEQWAQCVPKLSQELEKNKVLGLDCEWVLRQPVALLQISTSSHYCVLVRLCFMHKASIPQSLKTLLADRSILKVGVGVRNDGLNLLHDYGLQVNGCVDLRDVLTRVHGIFSCERFGLQGLAKGVLGIHISKDEKIRCGNWEARTLKPAQIEYAAMDAIVGVDIFSSLVLAKILGLDPLHHPQAAMDVSPETVLSVTRSLSQGIVDVCTPRPRQYVTTNPNKNKHKQANQNKKSRIGAYGIRKRPVLDSCQLVDPDGQLLCKCNSHRGEWYIKKGFGEKISDSPFVVKLTYQPTGRQNANRDYFLLQKLMCVVCGETENYTRKYIVPQEYRKYFPRLLKWNVSHDVLLLCPPCHHTSCSRDGHLRMHLAQECGAPLNSGENSSVYKDRYLQQVKMAGRALKLNRDKIPAARIQELEKILFDYYGVPEISEDVINIAAELDIKQEKQGFINHGKLVVDYAAENGGLLKFQERWRRHFVDTMQPKFLPEYWTVDYVPENWGVDGSGEGQGQEEEEGQGEGDFCLQHGWGGGGGEGEDEEEAEEDGEQECDEDDEDERELMEDDCAEVEDSDDTR